MREKKEWQMQVNNPYMKVTFVPEAKKSHWNFFSWKAFDKLFPRGGNDKWVKQFLSTVKIKIMTSNKNHLFLRIFIFKDWNTQLVFDCLPMWKWMFSKIEIIVFQNFLGSISLTAKIKYSYAYIVLTLFSFNNVLETSSLNVPKQEVLWANFIKNC